MYKCEHTNWIFQEIKEITAKEPAGGREKFPSSTID
jgi:hypothetical protein